MPPIGPPVRTPRRLVAVLVLVVSVAALALPGRAQNFGGSHDRFFTLEWRVLEAEGRPTLAGYVRNEWNTAARNILLRVSELDAGGQPVDTVMASVWGDAPPGGRVFFKVPVRSTTATYRVEVQSYAWVHRGR